jgi:hypothetical protein
MIEAGNDLADCLFIPVERFLLVVDFPVHSYHK